MFRKTTPAARTARTRREVRRAIRAEQFGTQRVF